MLNISERDAFKRGIRDVLFQEDGVTELHNPFCYQELAEAWELGVEAALLLTVKGNG